jgi:putative NADH-flavin reductase
MNIAILGASGRVGTLILAGAIERHWEITAFVRNPSNLGHIPSDARVTVIQGDATRLNDIERALNSPGLQAVISAVGPTRASAPDLLAKTARHLLTAMPRKHLRRLITLTGAGAEMPGDPYSVTGMWMSRLMGWLIPGAIEDAREHNKLIRHSSLDWTIVRPPRLTDRPAHGAYSAGVFQIHPRDSVTRGDLAEFMLDQAVSRRYLRQAPFIVNAEASRVSEWLYNLALEPRSS